MRPFNIPSRALTLQIVFLASWLLLLPGLRTSGAAVQTAVVEATGHSVIFNPALVANGDVVFFTTHDGSTAQPLIDCTTPVCYISQEFFPPTLGGTTYIADYLIQDQIGIYEWGEVWMTFAASDADGDGALDVLERQKSGSFSFSGTTYPHWNAFSIYYNSSIGGSVVRQAGNYAGTYSGVFSNPSQTQLFAGDYGISGVSGSIDYVPGGDFLSWSFQRLAIDGSLETYSGTSPINRVSPDEIQIPSFSIYDVASSASILTYPATLYRDGFVFRGALTLDDGEPLTWWRDYVDFAMEVADYNDFNGDGLPDLSYVPEPGVNALFFSGVIGLLMLERRRKAS